MGVGLLLEVGVPVGVRAHRRQPGGQGDDGGAVRSGPPGGDLERLDAAAWSDHDNSPFLFRVAAFSGLTIARSASRPRPGRPPTPPQPPPPQPQRPPGPRGPPERARRDGGAAARTPRPPPARTP